ncbi:MAG: CoA transferase [Actinomycetia bacterium]|nr:CoA transferase [Actinomycetes bacterium]
MTINAPGDAGPPRPLAGIRVLEVAQWVFVPAASAILADWGADVIKVEHPVHGDAVRGLNQGGPKTLSAAHNTQHANRGKKGIGLQLDTPEGREILLRLVDECDVFLTNFLPAVRSRLGIDVDDIRARNPRVVYARGSGLGPRGDEREGGGFDYATFWGRAGVGLAFHDPSLEYPVAGNAAFGDLISAPILAGGIAAALLDRERTGRADVVDVSLLGVGSWIMAGDIVTAALGDPQPSVALTPHAEPRNALVNIYRTRDHRYIALVSLQSDRDWPEFCARVGRPDLIDDPRFSSAARRMENRNACVEQIDAAFAAKTLDEWRRQLRGTRFVWEAMQTPGEVATDPQVIANDYLVPVDRTGDELLPPMLVASPVQFDETSPAELRRAPEVGEHTEQVLLDLGYGWDDITRLKSAGIVN